MIEKLFMQSQQQIEQIIRQLGADYQVAVALAAVGMLAAIGIGVAWFVYEKWFTPQDSKDLRTAFRKKYPLLALGGDDGYLDFKPAPFSGPEGFLETKSVGKTQEHYSGALPRPVQFSKDDIELTDKSKNLEATIGVANFVSMLANRRLLLRGSRVPIWFGYRGKAILVSIYGIVAIQVIDAMSKLKEFQEIMSIVDIVAIKELFSEQWNESQLNAQETDKERKGELKAKKFAGKDSLIMFFAILIILVVLVILLIAASYFFSQPRVPVPTA